MATALIDGDIVAYRCAAAAQKDIDWGDGLEGKTITQGAAEANAVGMTKDWAKAVGAERIIVCLTSPHNFRKELAPFYKANRTGKEPPVEYWKALKALETEFTVARYDTLEADDVIGILATSGRVESPIIVSPDKDLRSVPGVYHNPLKSERPIRVNTFSADRLFMRQTLTGDVADNYKGCPGIGPKKADLALARCQTVPEMWHVVVDLYRKAGLTEDDALLQARLARILRHGEYDIATKKVRLWTP